MATILALANVQVFYDRAIEALRNISIDVADGATAPAFQLITATTAAP